MTTFIIPMAGKGSRTAILGECKPSIKISKKTILEWCLCSISNNIRPGDNFVLITTKYYNEKYKLFKIANEFLKKINLNNDIKTCTIDSILPGPVASISKCLNLIDDHKHAIVINVDQFILFNIPKNFNEFDIFVPIYLNIEGGSSYVTLDGKRILSIEEKKEISYYASSGVYGFKSGKLLKEIINEIIKNGPNYKDEFYLSPGINMAIKKGCIAIATNTILKLDLGNIDNIKRFNLIRNLLL